MTNHNRPDFEKLQRLFTKHEPPELRGYVAKAGVGGPALAGSGVPPLGVARFVPSAKNGLFVPTDAAGPAPIDYIGTYVTLDQYLDIGLPYKEPIIEAVIAHLAEAHDRETMLLNLALLNRAAADREQLAKLNADFPRILKGDARRRFEAVMASESGGEGHPIVARHPVLAAIRYLLTHPSEGEPREQFLPMVAAILFTQGVAMTLNTDQDPAQEGVEDKPAQLALEVVRNSFLYEHEDTWATIDRVARLWKDFGARLKRFKLRGDPAALLAEATGLELEEILGLGFALLAHSMQWEPGKPPYFKEDMGSGMAPAKIQAFVSLISGDAAAFGRAFRGRVSRYDFLPFQEKPVLRAKAGLLVLDEAFLWERVTSGLYWIMHDYEKARGTKNRVRWTQAYSEMVELMVEDQLHAMAPPVLGEGDTFYTEEDFGRAYPGKRCDAAIDFGMSMGLFEIVSGQVSVQTRIEGSAKKLQEDTERLVIKKCRQLHAAAAAVLGDEFPLTGVRRTSGLRITPVVVVGGGYPVNPFTIELIGSRLAGESLLTDARIEPLALVGLGELEMLEGLAESGPAATEILREWQGSGLRNVPLRNFLLHRFGQGGHFRPNRMREHVDSVLDDVVKRLKLPDDPGLRGSEVA
jgi:hypothetical protein